MNKIVIAGANGFIGRSLIAHLPSNYQIVALVRSIPEKPNARAKYVVWDGKSPGEWQQELEGAMALINLSGKSVDCRYNEKNKAEIFSSRLDSTRILGETLKAINHAPKIWLNAASATIYRHAEDRPQDEKTGEYGSGFSVEVCKQWEAAFYSFQRPDLRQVALRTAIVLGKDGGVMVPFKRLVRFGLGGKMGNGKQMFSWIHELDVVRAIEFLIKNEASSGSYNLAAPEPITNEVWMQALRQRYRMPLGIPTPKWMLELGAKLIKTETELILKSRWVLPKKLLDEGFEFRYPEITTALEKL